MTPEQDAAERQMLMHCLKLAPVSVLYLGWVQAIYQVLGLPAAAIAFSAVGFWFARYPRGWRRQLLLSLVLGLVLPLLVGALMSTAPWGAASP